jgi:hypothetical protein
VAPFSTQTVEIGAMNDGAGRAPAGGGDIMWGMASAPRTGPQRKTDALAKLAAAEADVWVASAASDGTAHLVPLSLAWDGEHVVLALEAESATARNITASGRARLALGPTRDVVMIDAALDSVVPVADAPPHVADGYAQQADWDPRARPDGYLFMLLTPRRIQAWREANELAGRTLMREGAWVV